MNKQLRRPVIAGNWKMNLVPQEATALVQELLPLVQDATCDVVLCAPFVDLPAVLHATKNSNVQVGAQNCHWEPNGAFTGEIAPQMLCDLGVAYVIVGHSERRTLFGDTDATVRLRTHAALHAGLRVILCVGEVLEQRQQGITLELVRTQTKIALQGLQAEDVARVVLAYEPVWAIGTGLTATAAQANEVNLALRQLVAELYSPAVADAMVIQYGGSMNAANAAELLAQPDVDGGLIGGASLKAADFASIVRAASLPAPVLQR